LLQGHVIATREERVQDTLGVKLHAAFVVSGVIAEVAEHEASEHPQLAEAEVAVAVALD
jgi:hypothetical protein